MFRFADPQAIFYILFVVLAFVFFLILQKRHWQKLQNSFGVNMWPLLSSSLSKKKRFLKWGLEFLCLAFLLIAFARPQMGQQKDKVKSLGVELLFLVDVSTSMLAEDVKPSRLEHAKKHMNSILNELAGDKVGLIAFAGSSVPLSPLTPDYSSVRMFIESISTDSVSTQGTNYEDALMAANKLLQAGGAEGDELSKATKVLVFLSDGEEMQGAAAKMAEELSDKGIRIFTIAFGSEKGGSIPMRDANGYLKDYKRDADNNIVNTQTKTAFLKDLASIGKGNFYFAVPGDRSAKQFADDLKKLELTEFESEMSVKYAEYFYIFISFALFFAFIELALGERKSASKLWLGRFEIK